MVCDFDVGTREVIWILLFMDGLRLRLLGFVWLFLGWFSSLLSPWIFMVGLGWSGPRIFRLLYMG